MGWSNTYLILILFTGRWSHIYKYLERPGPLCPPVFEPGEEVSW